MGRIPISDLNYTPFYIRAAWITAFCLHPEKCFCLPTCLDSIRADTSKQTNVCIVQQLKMQWPEVSLKEGAQKNVNQNYCRRSKGFAFILKVVHEAK